MADEVFYTDPNVVKEIAKLAKKDFYYLGLGTEIPSGANLNDYTTPGVYITPSDGVTVSLANRPDEVRGNASLIVRKVINGATLQTLKSNTNQVGASRLFDTGSATWGAWGYDSGNDSIIQDGKSNNWYWRKYANGMAECWGHIPVTWSNVVTFGNMKYSTASPSATALPITFTDVLSTCREVSDGSWWFVGTTGNNTRINHDYIYGSNASGSPTSQYVFIHVIGRWK